MLNSNQETWKSEELEPSKIVYESIQNFNASFNEKKNLRNSSTACENKINYAKNRNICLFFWVNFFHTRIIRPQPFTCHKMLIIESLTN